MLPSELSVSFSMEPFQESTGDLKNAINNWHTLRGNFSDPRAETLSLTGVRCSYVFFSVFITNSVTKSSSIGVEFKVNM